MSSDRPPFLRDHKNRYPRWEATVETLRSALANTSSATEEARVAGRLAEHLRLDSAHHEEAVELGVSAVERAKDGGDTRARWIAMLRLAVTYQYTGSHELAHQWFERTESAFAEEESADLEDFLYQHRGKFYAEAGDLDAADACFSEALRIRLEKGDESLVNSTRQAIVELEACQSGGEAAAYR